MILYQLVPLVDTLSWKRGLCVSTTIQAMPAGTQAEKRLVLHICLYITLTQCINAEKTSTVLLCHVPVH